MSQHPHLRPNGNKPKFQNSNFKSHGNEFPHSKAILTEIPNPLLLTGHTPEGHIQVMLDTGSQMNFICENMCDPSKIVSLTDHFEVSLANRSKEIISKKTCITFTLDVQPSTTYTIQPYAISDIDNIIILGLEFFRKAEVTFDYEPFRVYFKGVPIVQEDGPEEVNPFSERRLITYNPVGPDTPVPREPSVTSTSASTQTSSTASENNTESQDPLSKIVDSLPDLLKIISAQPVPAPSVPVLKKTNVLLLFTNKYAAARILLKG